jgi:hypothetical protein
LEAFKEKNMGQEILNEIQTRNQQSKIIEKSDNGGFFSNIF